MESIPSEMSQIQNGSDNFLELGKKNNSISPIKEISHNNNKIISHFNSKKRDLISKNIEPISENKNKIMFYSKIKKENIFIPTNKEDIFTRLNNIMEQENQSLEYKKRIIKVFKEFIEYIKNQKPKSVKFIEGKDGKILIIVKRINISDIYHFINSNERYSHLNSKNYILSRIRKFVRILNGENNINYKTKLSFNNIRNKENELKEPELIKIAYFLKELPTPQLLLIFYFLYFCGLSYSMVSRITLKDFKKSFELLILKKGKRIIKRKISSIISKNLINFFKKKNNSSKFLFYDSIKDIKTLTRTMLIKNNVRKVINEISDISLEIKNKLLLKFSNLRKSVAFKRKYYYLFDLEFNLKNIIKDEKQNIEGRECSKIQLIKSNNNTINLNEEENFISIKEDYELFSQLSNISYDDNFLFLSENNLIEFEQLAPLLNGNNI